MQFEDVSFEMIGRGGTEGDRPLVALVSEAMQHLAVLVQEEDRADKATLTVTVTVAKSGEGAVTIAGGLKTAEPKQFIKALSAQVAEDGRVLAAQHKQLPLAGVTPIKNGESNAQ